MSDMKTFLPYIRGERIYLREVRSDDVNDNYCRWMNDSEVTRYLENRFFPNDMDSLRESVENKIKDRSNVFLAIVRSDTEEHIGNIKLGPIDWIHRLADVGVLIGEKECWGKGYATEAIGLVVRLAFQELNLHKLTAGYYMANKGSEKAFRNNGFVVEGIRVKHRFCEGSYVDTVNLGLLNERFSEKKADVKIVAIIQGRMGSSRLPGKVMAELAGKPMLFHVVNRIRRAKKIHLVAVATSTHASDDPIARFCREEGIPCFRGSEEDVLDRFYQSAKHFQADIIVRLTSDCPLHDPSVIDRVVEALLEGDADFVSGGMKNTYPDGLDAAAFPMAVLERTWFEARLKSEREHVTPYIHHHPEIFRLKTIRHTEDLSHLRWTVDEPRDLEFVRAIYSHMGNTTFGMDEVLDLLKRYPELNKINVGIARNEGYLLSLETDAPINGRGES